MSIKETVIEFEVEVDTKVEVEEDDEALEEDVNEDDIIDLISRKKCHISPHYRIKHQIDLKFCNICKEGYHPLEYFPIVLEKVMTKRNVNLLHTVRK
jgi:hypothetical protein